MRDVGIADRLRAQGLKVVEVDGWRSRGSDTFTPRGSVDHHTAGASKGNAPSLGVCINGRADLPGPLCNVMVGRDNTCYVVASGRANHAGKGGWKGLSGNSSVFGVERENVGTGSEPWRADQTATAAAVHAALIRGLASPEVALCCEHKEWAPGRKSDAHTITGDDMRAAITARLHLTEGDDMTPDQAGQLQRIENMVTNLQDVSSKFVQVILQQIKDAVDNPDVAGGTGQISAADIDAIADELFAREAKAAQAAVTK